MISLPNADIEQLKSKLEARRLDALVPDEWGLVVLDLIREEESFSAGCEHGTKHTAVEYLPFIWVDMLLQTGDRDGSRATWYFEDHLSTCARKRLCEGITSIARCCYEAARSGDQDAAFLLEEVCGISGLLDGVIRTDLIQEIVLDQHISEPLRGLLACSLVGREFCSAPPKSFWKALEERLPGDPALIRGLIDYYTQNDNPSYGIGLLRLIQKTGNLEHLGISLQAAIKAMLRPNNKDNREYLKETIKLLPAWAVVYIKEEVFPLSVDGDNELLAYHSIA